MTRSISPAWNTPAHLNPQSSTRGKDCVPSETASDRIRINSPLLFKLFSSLPDHKHSILDISRANPQSLNFFADFSCKLYLSNSINELATLKNENIDTPHKWHRALVKSMGFYKKDSTGLNIILLWGYPNYLSEEQLKGLIEYLLPQSSPRAFLHMYIHNSEHMAEHPANYRISEENKVMICPEGSQIPANCPCYNLKQLEKLLTPFSLDHSVMLSSGIQEYLFQLD